MTLYELGYSALRLGLEPIYAHVHEVLRSAVAAAPAGTRILDIGGRNSPYTVGLDAAVVVTDLPRKSETQRARNLGIDIDLAARLRRRRSNLAGVVFDDMNASALRPERFDVAAAVEVLEDIETPERFVRNVASVLSSAGTFVMTSPNGARFDLRTVGNPDNRQFFTRDTLSELLSPHFRNVAIEFVVFDCSLGSARGR